MLVFKSIKLLCTNIVWRELRVEFHLITSHVYVILIKVPQNCVKKDRQTIFLVSINIFLIYNIQGRHMNQPNRTIY